MSEENPMDSYEKRQLRKALLIACLEIAGMKKDNVKDTFDYANELFEECKKREYYKI